MSAASKMKLMVCHFKCLHHLQSMVLSSEFSLFVNKMESNCNIFITMTIMFIIMST